MNIKLMLASTAALALIATAPAYAAKTQDRQAAENGGGGASSKAKARSERKTCKTFDSTESRMKRETLCLTREGWKEFERAREE